ncbi:glycosyltransferase [Pedobacter sp. HDW13]|uniref:glycosyltransferase family 2 protein n=1 Tax=Pedobacter sp. HDW13 TaxID=2714940 RepID=UPI00140B5EEF|nr:glycosyltransferase [Pedobacter sp. HDW13]QIL38191.1 glycosyltransferase [Pedobacter sp. HDW13]
MNLKPETTILIPSYNCGKYLYECLGSIFRQNYNDYEILIIDDGSTDNTEFIVSSFNSPKIRYYKNKRNQGIVSSLNKGIDLSNGIYIARMDADDIMLGDRLQRQIEFLRFNQDYGMVGGHYQIMDNGGTYLESIQTSDNPEFVKMALLFRNQFHHSAVTMRTALAKKLKYNEDYIYCEDHELWIRFAEISKVANIQENFLSYRWHIDNSCNKNQDRLKITVLGLLSRELDKLGVEHSADELKLHGAMCFGMGKHIFRNEETIEELHQWHDKLFQSATLRDKYSEEWLTIFRAEILKLYCGLNYGNRSIRNYGSKTFVSAKAEQSEPGISVIMPTFNQSAFILAAISSLISQTYSNWELIIVNDGCTDDTEEIISEYLMHPKINYIKNNSNEGIGASINTGLDLASFDLIAYLPSDDLYHKNHLETLSARLKEDAAFIAISGIIYNHAETINSSRGAKSTGIIPGLFAQLVQVLHRKTSDRWVERKELVTADLGKLFWNNFFSIGKVSFTKIISCEWVSHPMQHHQLVSELKRGGIYTYKQYYNVEHPIRFKGSGNLIDEESYYSKVNIDIPPIQTEPLKILLVGELSLNPERIVALEEKGHQLFGLWMKASGFLNSVAPFAFGKIKTLSAAHYAAEIKAIKPDVIYALLNYVSVPFAHKIMLEFPDIPFVWHFKESPTYCKQYGIWNELISLFRNSDGQVYLSEDYKRWFSQYLDTNRKPSIILDGDLPKENFFTDDRSPLLSDSIGGIHTVLPGRPYGLRPEDLYSFAKQNIHLHFYGDFHQNVWRKWVEKVYFIAKGHLHIHPNCNPSDWVREFSQYDAGWLHMFPSENQGELSRTTWDDLNLPARMPTLIAAGLPLLHKNDCGHINTTFSLLSELDMGIFFDSFDNLSASFDDKSRIIQVRENVWSNRKQFTFDYHVDRLISFFRKVIVEKKQVKINSTPAIQMQN